MARTDLTPALAARSGLAWAGVPANVDGHAFGDNGKRLLRFKNSDAAARTVTIATTVQIDGLDVEDLQVVIPASTGDVTMGPFTGIYRQPNGKVHVDYDDVDGLSVQLIEVLAA